MPGTVRPLDLADAGMVRACYGVHAAALRADDPFEPPVALEMFTARLGSGFSGAPREAWYLPDEAAGTVAAWYQAELPALENQDRVFAEIEVHPGRRRRGLGTALLRHAGERAAAGYSLVSWEGVAPEERLDQVAALHNALNDAPMDAGVEPTAWTAERIRERMNTRIARSPSRRYSLAAVHDASGEMAALTAVSVHHGVPDWGHQLITAVARPHRGHRLGLLVKIAMLDWLTAAEPAVRRILTWNAGSNTHMIAINEQMGYQVWGRPYRSVELPVSSVRQS